MITIYALKNADCLGMGMTQKILASSAPWIAILVVTLMNAIVAILHLISGC